MCFGETHSADIPGSAAGAAAVKIPSSSDSSDLADLVLQADAVVNDTVLVQSGRFEASQANPTKQAQAGAADAIAGSEERASAEEPTRGASDDRLPVMA